MKGEKKIVYEEFLLNASVSIITHDVQLDDCHLYTVSNFFSKLCIYPETAEEMQPQFVMLHFSRDILLFTILHME